VNWTHQQSQAIDAVARWLGASDLVFYLGGYAGVGKTTLAQHLVAQQSRRWLFASYTGRAASVMRRKGCDGARTIHSLIYRPSGDTMVEEIRLTTLRIQQLERTIADDIREEMDGTTAQNKVPDLSERIRKNQARLAELRVLLREMNTDQRSRFSLWPASELADPDVAGIVVDECSMVDHQLAQDLESFEKKILVLGDPAQLPPVGAGGYYTEREPDFLLTEVHRQSADSGILSLATHVRQGGRIDTWEPRGDDVRVVRVADTTPDDRDGMMHEHDQTLVGKNATRIAACARWRERSVHAGTEPPQPGELLVCLRNDQQWGLLNGTQWTVLEVSARDDDALTCVMKLQEVDGFGTTECEAWLHHLVGRGDELDAMGAARRDLAELTWGAALTVHKAQGGQWNDVLLCDESRSFRDARARWLYTGVTRAARKLTVLV
jgi:exodeoxyribonuclease-5